ncbi:MAG: M20 family metallopeptidase [Terricaulis sp.]
MREDLIAFRRDLHRHPEVSSQEVRTAARIADRLEQLGANVRRNIGGHGVVAVLRGARPGPVIAFRADMDAVLSDAPDPVDFASVNPGVRHICGHDIHATIGIALAEAFSAIRQNLAGTMVLIFQPAEENVTGARLMIEAGALEDPRPDAIFAYHTAPYEVGQIAYSETTLMAARDLVTATVTGATRAAADDLRSRILSLGNISSLNTPQPIGSDFIWAGAAPIADTLGGVWVINANFSLATETARSRLLAGIDQAVRDLSRLDPSPRIEVNYQAGASPGVANNSELTRGAVASIRTALGDSALVQVRNVLPGFSEDFGHMQAVIPGAMFFLGVSNASRGWQGFPHSPNYVADEEAIFVGARAMISVMLDRLATS